MKWYGRDRGSHGLDHVRGAFSVLPFLIAHASVPRSLAFQEDPPLPATESAVVVFFGVSFFFHGIYACHLYCKGRGGNHSSNTYKTSLVLVFADRHRNFFNLLVEILKA